MLVNLDVLIGLSVVMLGLSLVAMVIAQAAAGAMGLRGTNLRWGLSMLLQQLHSERFPPPAPTPKLFGADVNRNAGAVVAAVLSYPLVSDSKVPIGRWKLATTIRFDEFVKTVALLGSQPQANPDLQWLRDNNRVTQSWFDSTMERVSQRFTMHMRIYTVVISTLLVATTGVDTFYVLKTLRNDASVRSGLVTAAQSIAKEPSVGTAARQDVQMFADTVMKELPKDQSVWALLRPGWPPAPGQIPGILVSVVLLSLGAPFWFNALKNLAALRPAVAKNEDQQRAVAMTPDVGDGITWTDLVQR